MAATISTNNNYGIRVWSRNGKYRGDLLNIGNFTQAASAADDYESHGCRVQISGSDFLVGLSAYEEMTKGAFPSRPL